LPREIPRGDQEIKAAVASLFLLFVFCSAARAADQAAIARGAYLAAAAGCDQCHTDAKNGGAPYAGGRALQTPFGAIPTPNITPDVATGIGGWSNADFTRAMRWGIAPDGTHYVPAFPFPYFARLTDADLADLKAFLDSLPPVSHPVAAPNSLALFARARAATGTAIAGISASLPAPSSADGPVARGAYLVATVGRCGDCHTPLTWLGAPDADRFLAGRSGALEGSKAPDITPNPKTGIGKWSTDDILFLLKDGGKPDGDFVGGGMGEIVRDTARLTDDDRRAIAAYLKTVLFKPLENNQ
jgi:mono/diheme cytochrome c family protein